MGKRQASGTGDDLAEKISPEEKKRRRYAQIAKEIIVKPKHPEQEPLIEAFEHAIKVPTDGIIIIDGPAGTGKTFLTAALGLKGYLIGRWEKALITRALVRVEDQDVDLGALPGSLMDKFGVWVRPQIDALFEAMPSDDHSELKQILNRDFSPEPMDQMRGRNLKNYFAWLDDAQNASAGQAEMIVTRIAENTTLVISGDSKAQKDNENRRGMDIILDLNEKYNLGATVIRLSEESVVRSNTARIWGSAFRHNAAEQNLA